MKHAVLTSIAHNIADSLGCGIGLLVGVFEMDVFGEALRSEEGFIEVDFLTGETSRRKTSPALARAIHLYSEALPKLCEKHGVAVTDFVCLTCRYSGIWPHQEMIIEVTDRRNRTSRDVYVGAAAARPKQLDHLGRIRRVKSASPLFK